MTTSRVDIETDRAAVGAGNLLGLEVDREDRIGTARRVIHQLVQVVLTDDDRQDAVLEAVVVEDVGEAGGDDAADSEVEKSPGRMFPRGAAAEIIAGDENLGIAVGGIVENERSEEHKSELQS